MNVRSSTRETSFLPLDSAETGESLLETLVSLSLVITVLLAITKEHRNLASAWESASKRLALCISHAEQLTRFAPFSSSNRTPHHIACIAHTQSPPGGLQICSVQSFTPNVEKSNGLRFDGRFWGISK